MTDQQLATLVWFGALTFGTACTFAAGFLVGWLVGNNNTRLRI